METWIRSIPLLAVPTLLLLWVGHQTRTPAHFYLEDPAALLKLPIGTAGFATLGICIWCMSAALCLFTGSVVPSRARTFLSMGLFCLWLGIDDTLLIHEDFLPKLFSEENKTIRNLVECSLFGAYATFLLSWLAIHRKTLSKLHWSLLGSALLLFSLSLSIDLARAFHLFDPWSPMVKDRDYAILVEDSPKILGLAFWLLFLWHYCKSAILERLPGPKTNAN